MALKDFFKRALTKTVVVQDRNEYFKSKINAVNNINVGRAEQNSTVFTCINLLQSMVSKCDIEIYQNIGGRKSKVTDHFWYDTVRFNPDLKLSTKKYLGYALTSMYLDGNFFAYVDPISRQLHTLGELEKISPVYEGDTYYKFKGIDTWLPSSTLIHFYLISKDGKIGLNPIDSIRAELEIQKGGETGVMNYYKNGLNNQLYLKPDIDAAEKFGDKNKAKEFLTKVLEDYGGIFNNHSIPTIPALYELKSLPQPQLDFLENNKYSIAQIGALFGVPEPFLGIQGNSSTYGKASEQVALFNSTLSNITTMITDELNNKLLTVDERKSGLYCGFDLKNLYETDFESKATYLAKLNAMGAINANEIRQEFNLEYVDLPGMNVYFRQAQYVDINASGATNNNLNFIQAQQL
jgi:HK97 family phage portal protein